MNRCYRKYEFLLSASVTTVQSSAHGHANSPKIWPKAIQPSNIVVLTLWPGCLLWDLSLAPFVNVFSFSEPNQAPTAWYEAFLPVVEKHAPIRKRRVKHPTLPQWLSSEIIKAMKLRDRLKRDKKFEDYKKQRNKVTSLVRAAKKAYFAKLINDNKDTASLWRAMTEITHKSRNKVKTA